MAEQRKRLWFLRRIARELDCSPYMLRKAIAEPGNPLRRIVRFDKSMQRHFAWADEIARHLAALPSTEG